MNPRLLIATDGLFPRIDGIAVFIDNIVPRIQDSFDITIAGPNSGDYDFGYDAKMLRFRTLKIRFADNYNLSIVNIRQLSREIKKTDAVFVQCLGPIGIWSIILAKLHKKPILMYAHMQEWEVYAKSQKFEVLKVPINVVTHFFSGILYNQCNLIIAPSAEQAELINFMSKKPQKKIVHLGVNIKKFKPAASKAVAKNEIGIEPTKFVVGYAGRVSYEKDLKTLYRAFVRLEKKFEDVILLIAGGGHPGLEKLFSNKKNVILTGLKEDLAVYYQAMDVYVLPSLTETSSLTTMEAMATGTPVVVTPVGFIKEYINNGHNGLIFPKKNSYNLYTKLKHLLENDEVRDRLGRNGRDTIISEYSWDNTAEALKKHIGNLIPVKHRSYLAE